MATNQNTFIQFGNAGTSGDIGTTVQLQEREGSSKSDLLLSTPLSLELNIDNNNSPRDNVIFTAGSGSNRRVIAILDDRGNLKIAGRLTENASL